MRIAAGIDPPLANVSPEEKDPAIDQQLYIKLVETLYSTPKSIVSASVAALAIIAVAWIVSADWCYAIFMVGFTIVGAMRAAASWVFARSRPLDMNPGAVGFWENLARAGAWSFAGLIGLIGAYTIYNYPFTPAEILINCGVMGYVAGISSRNAGRPVISIGQISFACVPVLVAMVAASDIVHQTLALFIGALYLSTIVMAKTMHENIVARYKSQQELEAAALYDTLTGVGSRMAFTRDLEQQLVDGQISRTTTSLLAIDLDMFKDVNDTLGHPAGDAVLKETARRIQATAPGDHNIARIGGDEFLVSFQGRSETETEEIAQAIIAALSAPIFVGAVKVSCGASAGQAMAPRDATTLEEMMQCADLALYAAKSGGRGRVAAFSPILARNYLNRIELERGMQTGMENDEFSLVYQPIVDPKSGRPISCKALLRWHSSTRGTVSPVEFIPIAEASGLIIPLGAWVLKTACRDAASWPNDTKVSVNLSFIQFRAEESLVDTVETALRESGLPPERLILEITESVVIEDTEKTLRIVEQLREMNIGVSMDDFGTGYSSFAYLNDFPFSQIKFDRKFSQDIASSPRTKSIVEAVTRLCQKLGMAVVAEGVETPQQLLLLHSLGINSIQGYIYSKPVPVETLVPLIEHPIELTAPPQDDARERTQQSA